MKRIRTIHVALVILLVSTTMVFGVANAAPVQPDVGPGVLGDPLSGSVVTGTDGGVLPDPPGGGDEGDPDDTWGASGNKTLLPSIADTQGATSDLGWFEIIYLMTVESVRTLSMF